MMQRTNSLEKTLMLGKIEGKRRRWQQRMRWLDGIRLNGHEFEQTQGDGEGQGSLVCYSSWVCKESDMTEQLKNSNKEMDFQMYHASRSLEGSFGPSSEFLVYNFWSRAQ